MPILFEQIVTPDAQDLTDLVKIYLDYPQTVAAESSQQATIKCFQERLAQPDQTLYAARFNGRLLAAVWINTSSDHWQLEQLCVRKLTRRRGVASKLLSDLQALARRQHTALGLSIKQSDPAIEQLMDKLGFMSTSADTYQWIPAEEAVQKGDQGSGQQ